MTQSQKHARAGFTLIEIMIAIIIVGIMGAVVGPAILNYQKKARKTAVRSTLKAFKQGIMLYQSDTGKLPARLRDLVKKPREEVLAKKWEGPYLDKKEIPEDPWGNKFQYKPTASGKNPYELYSYGPNGKGSPKSEYISVWDE